MVQPLLEMVYYLRATMVDEDYITALGQAGVYATLRSSVLDLHDEIFPGSSGLHLDIVSTDIDTDTVYGRDGIISDSEWSAYVSKLQLLYFLCNLATDGSPVHNDRVIRLLRNKVKVQDIFFEINLPYEESKSSPCRESFDRDSALLLAAMLNLNQAVKLMLEAGADPDYDAGRGESPMSIAVARGNFAMVSTLLTYGASLANTWPPWFSRRSPPSGHHWKAAEKFLDPGPPYDNPRCDRSQHLLILEALIDFGADCGEKDRYGLIALEDSLINSEGASGEHASTLLWVELRGIALTGVRPSCPVTHGLTCWTLIERLEVAYSSESGPQEQDPTEHQEFVCAVPFSVAPERRHRHWREAAALERRRVTNAFISEVIGDHYHCHGATSNPPPPPTPQVVQEMQFFK